MQYILWSTDSDKGDFGLSEVGKNKKIKTVGSIFFLSEIFKYFMTEILPIE